MGIYLNEGNHQFFFMIVYFICSFQQNILYICSDELKLFLNDFFLASLVNHRRIYRIRLYIDFSIQYIFKNLLIHHAFIFQQKKILMSAHRPQVHFGPPPSGPYFQTHKPITIPPNPHVTLYHSKQPPSHLPSSNPQQQKPTEKQISLGGNESKSSTHPAQLESKKKVQQMTEDLVKLKRQLDSILKDTNEKKKNYEEKKSNRSVQVLHAPHRRVPTPTLEEISSAKHPIFNGVEITESVPETQRNRIKTETSLRTTLTKTKLNTDSPSEIMPESYSRIKKKEECKYNKEPTFRPAPVLLQKQTQTTHRRVISKKYQEEKLEYERKLMENQQTIQTLKFNLETMSHENQFIKDQLSVKNEKINELNLKNKILLKEKEQAEQKEGVWKQRMNMVERQFSQLKGKKKSDFEVVLKSQLDELSYFKEIIENKNQEISHLNEVIIMNRRKTEDAINDSNMDKLKHLSEMKKSEQKYEISLLNKENQIKNLKNTLGTIQSKLQAAIREVKTKDEFIQAHLVGRLHVEEEQEYVKQVLQKYQLNFVESELLQKLMQEQKQIEELKAKLQCK